MSKEEYRNVQSLKLRTRTFKCEFICQNRMSKNFRNQTFLYIYFSTFYYLLISDKILKDEKIVNIR